MKTIVLMYHGLYESDTDLGVYISKEDQPYAVSREKFRRHLALIQRKNVPEKADTKVILTFDDGHISNHRMALPDLCDFKMTAYFFVTSDFMRLRDHFCRSEQIRELHNAGMIIGAHGVSHRFLDDDLSIDELKLEFSQSKSTLEQAIGTSVNSISFPGGRYSEDSMGLAKAAGFEQLFGSRTGINHGSFIEWRQPIQRVAIRKTTTDLEFSKIISADAGYYSKIAIKQTIKIGLRKTLGNRLYHGLYKSIAG